jgi:cobalt-zinc-cadmium efflux system protein
LTHHHHHHTGGSSRDLLVAFALNTIFTLLEIVGGLLINSVAVLSDALHDLGDSFSLGLAWFLNRYSEKESDENYSYGYVRFSLLGALINTIVLVVGALFVLDKTIPRLFNPESFNAPGMVAFAVIGVTVNGLAAWRLRGQESRNVQIVGWHLLEDVLGWSAVLVVGLVSLVVDVPILDPLLSIGITAYVLYNVIGKLRDTVKLFMQAVPGGIDLDEVRQRLLAVEGVQDIHHTHIWSLDGENHVFSTHLIVTADTDKADALCIKQTSRDALRDLGLAHVTIEIEYGDADCSMRHEAEAHH